MEPVKTIEARYNALFALLDIDMLRIDQQLMRMAHVVQDCAELAATADREYSAAKQAYDIIVSQTATDLRLPETGGKPLSEATITSLLPAQPAVQAAKEALNAAQYWTSVCNALVGSMREKSNLVRKACDMTIAGYITPSSYAPARAKLAAKKD